MSLPSLSILVPNVPSESDCGIRFTLDSQYGIIVIRADELRPRTLADPATDRFVRMLLQTHVVMVCEYGSDRYYIDGPNWLVEMLMIRAKTTVYHEPNVH